MRIGWEKFWRDVKERRHRFRQVMGGFFAVALFAIARPEFWMFVAGAAVIGSGEAIRLWAAGHVRKNESLCTDGPYAFVRHPQYLGNTLLAVGLSLVSGHPWAVAVWGILFWLYYVPAIQREDERLHHHFGRDWEEWRENTPAVVPTHWPSGRIVSEGSAWSPMQALRNGEPFWALLLAGGLFAIYRWFM
jgi:hypothetical protein